jgi:hypothetical protein
MDRMTEMRNDGVLYYVLHKTLLDDLSQEYFPFGRSESKHEGEKCIYFLQK